MKAIPFSRSSRTFTLRATLRVLAIVAAASALACTAKKASADLASASRDQATESSSSDQAMGSGHLHLTGDVTLDHDFLVDGCQISPPGDGLLAGYRMQAKEGDSAIVLLSAAVKSYDKDGPYSPTYNTSIAQANEVMSSGSQDFLTLMIKDEHSPAPLAVGLKPASKLVTTISANGTKGEVTFSDMESQISFADMTSNSGKNRTVSAFQDRSSGRAGM